MQICLTGGIVYLTNRLSVPSKSKEKAMDIGKPERRRDVPMPEEIPDTPESIPEPNKPVEEPVKTSV